MANSAYRKVLISSLIRNLFSLYLYQMLEKSSGVIENVKTLTTEVWISTGKTRQSICTKLNKSRKMRQERKLWYLILLKLWTILHKSHFLKGSWTLGWVPTWFCLLIFHNLPILKSFYNSWDNSYFKSVLLDINVRFTLANQT